MITEIVKDKNKNSLLKIKPNHKLDEYHFGILQNAGFIKEVNIVNGEIESVIIDLHTLVNKIVYNIV